MTVRRLSAGTIERRANMLLADYQGQFGRIAHPPVHPDEILERGLRLTLDLDDLNARFGIPAVHGLTDAQNRAVFIDESLDPSLHPEMEGRFNFTVAHEIGHWRLHPHMSELEFLTGHNPRLVSSGREMERQANKFAAYLLMPEYLVRREWRAQTGLNAHSLSPQR